MWASPRPKQAVSLVMGAACQIDVLLCCLLHLPHLLEMICFVRSHEPGGQRSPGADVPRVPQAAGGLRSEARCTCSAHGLAYTCLRGF